MSWESCHFTWKRCNYSCMSQRCDWVSLPPVSRSATAPSSTAAFSSTRASRCARPTITSPAAACVRPASSPSWGAASPPWGPNSTHITSCVTSAWSRWAKAASRSRRTNPTATPASSSSLVEGPAGLRRPALRRSPDVTLSSLFFFPFFCYCGSEGGAGLFVNFEEYLSQQRDEEEDRIIQPKPAPFYFNHGPSVRGYKL